MRGSARGLGPIVMAAVLVSLLAAPAIGTEPPEDAAIALFAGDTVTSVVSTPTTIGADAPFLPDGVDVPAPGWQILVEGSDAAGNGAFSLFYAVGDIVWLVAEGSATVVEPAVTEVLAVVVEHNGPRFSARGPYPI